MRISAYNFVMDYAYRIVIYDRCWIYDINMISDNLLFDYDYWSMLWHRYDIWYDTVMILIPTVSMNVYVMTVCMPGFHHWVASHITRQHFSDPSE